MLARIIGGALAVVVSAVASMPIRVKLSERPQDEIVTALAETGYVPGDLGDAGVCLHGQRRLPRDAFTCTMEATLHRLAGTTPAAAFGCGTPREPAMAKQPASAPWYSGGTLHGRARVRVAAGDRAQPACYCRRLDGQAGRERSVLHGGAAAVHAEALR